MTKYSNQYHSLSPSLVSLINRSGPTSWIRDFFILAGAVELWSCGAVELGSCCLFTTSQSTSNLLVVRRPEPR